MTTFTAYFRTDAETACRKFEARTPKQALALARKFYNENPLDLYFESYDSGMSVNEIAISDADGNECAVWLDDDLRLRFAAQDLLSALEQAMAALNTAPRFPVPSLLSCSYRIAATCEKAIAKAKGGAA
jgi:hypothetical protein